MAKHVDIAGSVKAGWRSTLDNLGLMLGLGTAYFAASLLGERGGAGLKTASWVVQTLLMAVIILVCVRLAREPGRSAGLAELPLEPMRVLRFFAVTLLTLLLMAAGLLLLIVPGVYWGLKYGFSAAFVLEEDDGILEVMRRSAELTEGVKWELLAQVLVFIGILLLGLLALLVGVVPAFLLVQLAWAWTYVDLRRQMDEGA